MKHVMVAGLCISACLFAGCDTKFELLEEMSNQLNSQISACLSVGCDTVIHGAQEALKKQLIDPDSAKFEDVHVVKSTGAVCGYVNAKNRMGGYVGQTPFFYTQEEGAVLVKDMPSESDYESVFGSEWSTEDEKIKIIFRCMHAHKWEKVCKREGFFPANKYCSKKA